MKFLKKTLQKLHETLPGKRVFFIYTHNNGYDRFCSGLKANTEISYWNYQALKKEFPKVTFLKLEKEDPRKINKITSQDVVVGHIGETFLKASERTNRIIAFYPWAGHSDRSESVLFNCIPKEVEWNYLNKAQSVIFLTSEYNLVEYIQKPKNFWHPYLKEMQKIKKLRIVHQPIDLTCFSRVKFEYLTSDFLYVGNDAHMKCVEDSRRLVKATGSQFYTYGIDNLRLDNLDKNAVSKLATKADFFIQPGMWEGQCVAILESAARGFIPIVSKETGYPYDHPFLLRFNDFDHNLKVLQQVVKTSAEERKSLADTLYQQLINDKNHNDWSVLTQVVVDEVKALFYI